MASNQHLLCPKCNKNINLNTNKSILCDGSCSNYYHKICTGLSAKRIQNIESNDDEFWLCEICKEKRTSRRITQNDICQTDTINIDDETYEDANENGRDENVVISSDEIPENVTIQDVYRLLREMGKTLNALIAKNNEMETHNSSLERKVEYLEGTIHDLKQQQLNYDLEVNGVEAVESENLVEIVSNLALNTGVVLEKHEIKEVFRKKTNLKPGDSRKSGFPASIIVRFHSKTKRDEFMNKRKQKIVASNLNEKLPNNRRIYLNEHLTYQNKHVLFLARELRRKNIIKYAWAKDGKIYVREKENSDPIIYQNFIKNQSNKR